MGMRKLIPYAGYEHELKNNRRIPVERAIELRATGMTWREVAMRLTEEFDRSSPYTADGVYTAVHRTRKKESTNG